MCQKLQKLVKTVKFKILLTLLAFCLVFLLAFSFFYLRATDALTDRILASYDDMLSMYIGQLDAQILSIENYLYNLSTDFDVNTLAIRSPRTDEYVLTKFRIYVSTLQAYSTYNLLDAVYFYDQRDDSVFVIPNDSKRYRSIVRITVEQGDTSGGNRWNLFQHEGTYLLAKQKRISDSIAVVFFIRVEDLARMLKSITIESGHELVVSSHTGERVYGSDLTSDNTTWSKAAPYYQISKNLDLTGLQFNLLVRKDNIRSELSFYTSFFVLSVALLSVIVAIVLYELRKYFLSPLDGLIVGMRDFAGGNEDVHLKRTGSTELIFAIETFNDMVYQIKNNRLLIYEEKLEKQKLLIQNLQAQIDPHFFSNTMNIIYNLIAINETEASKKCLLHLSEYYRHITKISRQDILLSDEIDFIRTYLEIMSLRFPGKLDISFHLSDELYEMRIPPLLVQPLVENSIKHGYIDHSRKFSLNIDTHVLEDCAIISVTDSGVGFPSVYCNSYDENHKPPSHDGQDDSHVGIQNIYQRLLMYYGENAKISIGRDGNLTRVEICICDWFHYK